MACLLGSIKETTQMSAELKSTFWKNNCHVPKPAPSRALGIVAKEPLRGEAEMPGKELHSFRISSVRLLGGLLTPRPCQVEQGAASWSLATTDLQGLSLRF